MCIARSALRSSLIQNHTTLPYTSTRLDVWDALKRADADPANPAKVILIYSNASVDGAQEYGGGAGWTREHWWPQSLMGASAHANEAPATDLHALRPASPRCNTMRSNHRFASLPNAQVDEQCRLACDTSAGLCEPPDRVKGPLARSLFYMAVRYDGTADLLGSGGHDWNDLILADVASPPGLLLQWSDAFPVTPAELRRNGEVAALQGQRNPFVDDPTLAHCFWGTSPASPPSPPSLPSPPSPPPSLASPRPPSSPSHARGVFVNELHYDNAGADVNEFVEVAGRAGASLDGWQLVLYGAGGAPYRTVALSGMLGSSAGAVGWGAASFVTTGLQNGPNDGVALVDDAGVLLDFVSYEGAAAAVTRPSRAVTRPPLPPCRAACKLLMRRAG